MSALRYLLRHPLAAAQMFQHAYETAVLEELLYDVGEQILRSRASTARADLEALHARAAKLPDDYESVTV